MESTAMGLPGVSFTPGLHICAFYRGPSQRDELLLPYLREGLAAGDKCICVTDDPAAGAAVCALAGEFGARGARAAAADGLRVHLPVRRVLRDREDDRLLGPRDGRGGGGPGLRLRAGRGRDDLGASRAPRLGTC